MTNLVDIKAQLSNDPIDLYIMEHTFRPTPEQTALIEHTRALPGRHTCSIDWTDIVQSIDIRSLLID
jgi:hypothetical protein